MLGSADRELAQLNYENMKIQYGTCIKEKYCIFLLLKVHFGRQNIIVFDIQFVLEFDFLRLNL